jgi:hypothetical protein
LQAQKAGDAKTVKSVYLDILDYANAGLKAEHIVAVFEALNYELCIDHGLVEHLGATGTKLGLMGQNINIKLHQAVYYIKIKGYLTAVDLLKEAPSSPATISTSELFKNHLFPALSSEEIEETIRAQMIEAVRQIPVDKWEDRAFYGLEQFLIREENEEQVHVDTTNNEQVHQQQQ